MTRIRWCRSMLHRLCVVKVRWGQSDRGPSQRALQNFDNILRDAKDTESKWTTLCKTIAEAAVQGFSCKVADTCHRNTLNPVKLKKQSEAWLTCGTSSIPLTASVLKAEFGNEEEDSDINEGKVTDVVKKNSLVVEIHPRFPKALQVMQLSCWITLVRLLGRTVPGY